MTNSRSLQMVPQEFRRKVLKVKRQILRRYHDTWGLILIGSVAEGEQQEDSDIDIVWIKGRKIGLDEFWDLDKHIDDEVQLVRFNRKQVTNHFRQATTMAHSMKKGVPLYQKKGFLDSLLAKELGQPDRSWMRYWFEHWLRFYRMGVRDRKRNSDFHKRFCKTECCCSVGDYLARATVNFAILHLETKGIVPTTKRKIYAGMRNTANKRLLKGLEIALDAHHCDRWLSKKEADMVFYAADCLRRRLKRWFG